MNKSSEKLIFCTESYAYLCESIVKQGGFEKGLLEITRFPDGERYMRILSNPEGRHVVVIGGTISDADTLELYDLACGAVKYGALSLTLVIPYFGYSTMERAVKPGEVVTAKTRAHLLSAIPRTPLGNKVMLFDLHTEGIPHYFESDIRPVHVYCKKIVTDAAREIGGSDFVMAATDAGRAKWVESLANEMGVNAAFVFKRRVSGELTKVTSISADVRGKTVIIYDDMIRTGGSLIGAAQSYLDAGASNIAVITTHGLFIGNGLKKIQDSGLFFQAVCTDTHPNALSLAGDFLKVKSIAKETAEYLKAN